MPAATRLQVVQYVEGEMELAGFALSPSLSLFRGCSVSFIHIVRLKLGIQPYSLVHLAEAHSVMHYKVQRGALHQTVIMRETKEFFT